MSTSCENACMPSGTMDQPSLFSANAGVREPAGEPREVFSYSANRNILSRRVLRRDGSFANSEIELLTGSIGADNDLAAAYDWSWLRAERMPVLASEPAKTLRIADLFSGCGGMTLGAVEACRALGYQAEVAFANDTNTTALAVYTQNFPTARISAEKVEQL